MTNIRAHVQLKGTESSANANGLVSRKVARTNLNYLLAQPNSIYVCYHVPSGRLLVRYAEDVYREYEHKGREWAHQDWITVNFTQLFDEIFQHRLNNRLLAIGKLSRQRRLQYAVTPPEQIPTIVQQTSVYIEVPANPEQAIGILNSLYEAGKDLVISESFERFSAVLDSIPGAMDSAYMAEINLGINGVEIDKNRVEKSIDELTKTLERGGFHTGSLLYCIGNGWFALREYQKAQDFYKTALEYLGNPHMSDILAQCCKNMGSVLEKLGNENDARQFYERAIKLNSYSSEANFALALWHLRNEDDLSKALWHFDQVTGSKGDSADFSSLQGWRIELLFKMNDITGAFREINNLLGHKNKIDWIWPWCARQVANFGTKSVEAAQKANRFWNVYLSEFPVDANAEKEYLLCNCYLRMAEEPSEINFEDFKNAIINWVDNGATDPAFLWDRIGHWAQADGDWVEAEKWFRKAYNLEPEQYGYCLGTALNFLDQYAEALPILLQQAEKHMPDAMSWFQVAKARDGIGDIKGCVLAYQRALEFDPDYDIAWFNLGGIYWNSKNIKRATEIWDEALERFPNHELAKKLRLDLPFFFEVDDETEQIKSLTRLQND